MAHSGASGVCAFPHCDCHNPILVLSFLGWALLPFPRPTSASQPLPANTRAEDCVATTHAHHPPFAADATLAPIAPVPIPAAHISPPPQSLPRSHRPTVVLPGGCHHHPPHAPETAPPHGIGSTLKSSTKPVGAAAAGITVEMSTAGADGLGRGHTRPAAAPHGRWWNGHGGGRGGVAADTLVFFAPVPLLSASPAPWRFSLVRSSS